MSRENKIPFYLITNKASLVNNPVVRLYPRHLILAHLLREDPAYAGIVERWIKAARVDERPLHVIMDNGAYEKQIVGTGDLVALAAYLKPDVIVMPDAVGEPHRATWELGQVFVEHMEKKLRTMHTASRSKLARQYDPIYMYVSQGVSPHDVMEGYALAMNKLDPQKYVMGLGLGYKAWLSPSDPEESEAARERMVEDIFSLPKSSTFRWHILGARWNATKHFAEYSPYICGLDTFKPCQSALNGMRYPGRIPEKVDHRDPRIVDVDILNRSMEVFASMYDLDASYEERNYMGS